MLDYHRTLLADDARMAALRAAIARVLRRGDVVVDLGCGTGILSFLALDAGAKHVYAIDQTHLADVAAFLARHLQFRDRMTVLHDVSTNVTLPERADVLLTETIGAAAFDEHILGAVIDARRRFLRDGAAIVPHALALHAVPVESPETHHRAAGFWSHPNLGYDFSPLRVFASNALHHTRVTAASQLADEAELVSVDLTAIESALVRGEADFIATRDGVVHGFGIWFHARLVEDITLTNRADATSSWTQVFLPLDEPVAVTRGAAIAIAIETDDGKTWRWSGTIANVEFDQMTMLNRPPCMRHD